jgi:hypothetical protein
MNLKRKFVPDFLRRFDKYLLLNLPFVWRTRVHYLLFYSLVADVILFLIGLSYPMDLFKLYAEGIDIIKNQEYIAMIMVLLSFLTLIYWWNQLSKYKTPIVDGKNILLEWLIYFVCVSAIILNSFMCTWGIQCKKAYFTTKEIHYDHPFLADNQHFQLGYITHYDADKNNNKAAYFKNGEALLSEIKGQIFGKKAHKALEELKLYSRYSGDNIATSYLEYFAHYTLADSLELRQRVDNVCKNQLAKTLSERQYLYENADNIAIQLSNQSSFLGNKQLIEGINDSCSVKSNLVEYMFGQQNHRANRVNNMWLREQFLATLNQQEKEAYKKALKTLDKYPIHWHSSNDDSYDTQNQVVERDVVYGWEQDILARLQDSVNMKLLITLAEKNKIGLDTLYDFLNDREYNNSSENIEWRTMSSIYVAWQRNYYKDSIDRLNPAVRPLADIFRNLVNQFDTLSFQKYLAYAQAIGYGNLIYENADTSLRTKLLDGIVAQSNKRYDYFKQSEKDSLLLLMNLDKTAAVELYNRIWTKEYSDYILKKYPLDVLEKLHNYHQINGFPPINQSDSSFKKQDILTLNNEFMNALQMVESAKVSFWSFRPLAFLFCVFGVNITFLLFFLSITSRGVIVTSLFIQILLCSCVLLVANILNYPKYIELFIVGSFALSGVLLTLLLFFAKSKIRFIEYYIIVSIFMGVLSMLWLFMMNESNTILGEFLRDYQKDAKDVFFYFFMLVLFSFALLYKRHLNLPNKK